MSAAEALAPEQTVEEVRESLSVTEKGQPANTIGNCRTVFCHDPLLRDAIRLNLLTDRVDIVRDLGIPPSAAITGNVAVRRSASSPTTSSRLSSSPATKKKIASRPSLAQSPTVRSRCAEAGPMRNSRTAS